MQPFINPSRSCVVGFSGAKIALACQRTGQNSLVLCVNIWWALQQAKRQITQLLNRIAGTSELLQDLGLKYDTSDV